LHPATLCLSPKGCEQMRWAWRGFRHSCCVVPRHTFCFALQDTNANKKNQRNVNNSLESVFRYAKICMVEITGKGLNPLRFEISQEVLECLQTAKASASQPAKDRVLQEFWHVGSSNKIFQVCMRLSRVINLMSDKTTVVVLIVLK